MQPLRGAKGTVAAALVLLLPLSYQACTETQFLGSDAGPLAATASGGGGNGDTFDGKPDPGVYARIIPGFKCANVPELYGKITVGAQQMTLRTINPADCSEVVQDVAAYQIDFRKYNPNAFGFADGVFEKLVSQGGQAGPTSEPVPDALCRRENPAGRKFDLAIRFDKSADLASASILAEALPPAIPGSGETLPVGKVDRAAAGTKITYSAPGFSLVIDRGRRLDSRGYVVAGRFAGDVDGVRVDEELACRLAGALDQQAYPPRPPIPPPGGALLFADGFESGGFDAWSWPNATMPGSGPGPEFNYAQPASESGLAVFEGPFVGRFGRPAVDSSPGLARIAKHWSSLAKTDHRGRSLERLPGDDPTAVYSARYFIPSDYVASATEWANIFSFNEEGIFEGARASNESWFLNLSAASAWGAGGSEPVIFVNRRNQNYSIFRPAYLKPPVGRWFEVRAELREGDRIDYYVDGVYLDAALHSVYPVGRAAAQHETWIWSVGHAYGRGHLYIDACAVRAFP